MPWHPLAYGLRRGSGPITRAGLQNTTQIVRQIRLHNGDRVRGSVENRAALDLGIGALNVTSRLTLIEVRGSLDPRTHLPAISAEHARRRFDGSNSRTWVELLSACGGSPVTFASLGSTPAGRSAIESLAGPSAS